MDKYNIKQKLDIYTLWLLFFGNFDYSEKCDEKKDEKNRQTKRKRTLSSIIVVISIFSIISNLNTNKLRTALEKLLTQYFSDILIACFCQYTIREWYLFRTKKKLTQRQVSIFFFVISFFVVAFYLCNIICHCCSL